MWGSMYIPYRKAYLSGMNPLSFVTFFTFGELGMMTALAVGYLGLAPLWAELSKARDILFWLMAGGFIWVVGDIFQQYAAKYSGISRGIPLSNTNQLWGLLWGLLVFSELHGSGTATYTQVVGGSLLMMLGVGAIAFSSATNKEQTQWKQAAQRESERYSIPSDYVEARMQGRHRQAQLHIAVHHRSHSQVGVSECVGAECSHRTDVARTPLRIPVATRPAQRNRAAPVRDVAELRTPRSRKLVDRRTGCTW